MQALDLQQLEGLFYGLLAAILIILALLIGYVIVANRRQRDRMLAAYEADKLAPRPVLTVTGQILSLARSDAGGALEVEIDGARYASLAEIEDPQVRRQVVGAALELVQFTGVLGQAAIAPAPMDATASWREDLRQSSQAELERIHSGASGRSEPDVVQAPEEVEEQFLSLLAELGQAPPPPEKPSIAGALRKRRLPRSAEEAGSPTFVSEIEEIVQRRIRLTPVLAGRSLHVRSGDGGTVRFAFEGAEYESLDELPNLTARQLVRDAIAEWDEKS